MTAFKPYFKHIYTKNLLKSIDYRDSRPPQQLWSAINWAAFRPSGALPMPSKTANNSPRFRLSTRGTSHGKILKLSSYIRCLVPFKCATAAEFLRSTAVVTPIFRLFKYYQFYSALQKSPFSISEMLLYRASSKIDKNPSKPKTSPLLKI
jgi:hypothetical protein